MTARAALGLLLLLVGAGCVNTGLLVTKTDRTRHPDATSARQAFEQFRIALRTSDYQAAYQLLSSDSQLRYKWFEFNLTFKETRFGALLRYLYTEWDVEEIETGTDDAHALVVLRHYIYSDQKRRVPMVREVVEGRTVWRVRWVLGNLIGMPESDERKLFPDDWEGASGPESDARPRGSVPAPRR